MSFIVILVSVDWEGRSLLDENLEVMVDFRLRHKNVPMQQFLNAAYYTKEEANISATTKKIDSVLLPEDDHGLHLHAWRSLFEKAGVTAKKEPVFIEMTEYMKTQINAHDWEYYKNDWGYDVPIDRYDTAELSSVIQTSINILTAQGFRKPNSFRAGGGMANQNVFNALAQNGFMLDSSAMNTRFFKQRFGDIPLCAWIAELWPKINDLSQPYKMNTSSGDIWQIPSNGCVADYTSTDEILDVFHKNVAVWKKCQHEPVFVSIGFHQETAARFLNRLDSALVEIKTLARKNNLPIVFSSDPLPYLR